MDVEAITNSRDPSATNFSEALNAAINRPLALRRKSWQSSQFLITTGNEYHVDFEKPNGDSEFSINTVDLAASDWEAVSICDVRFPATDAGLRFCFKVARRLNALKDDPKHGYTHKDERPGEPYFQVCIRFDEGPIDVKSADEDEFAVIFGKDDSVASGAEFHPNIIAHVQCGLHSDHSESKKSCSRGGGVH